MINQEQQAKSRVESYPNYRSKTALRDAASSEFWKHSESDLAALFGTKEERIADKDQLKAARDAFYAQQFGANLSPEEKQFFSKSMHMRFLMHYRAPNVLESTIPTTHSANTTATGISETLGGANSEVPLASTEVSAEDLAIVSEALNRVKNELPPLQKKRTVLRRMRKMVATVTMAATLLTSIAGAAAELKWPGSIGNLLNAVSNNSGAIGVALRGEAEIVQTVTFSTEGLQNILAAPINKSEARVANDLPHLPEIIVEASPAALAPTAEPTAEPSDPSADANPALAAVKVQDVISTIKPPTTTPTEEPTVTATIASTTTEAATEQPTATSTPEPTETATLEPTLTLTSTPEPTDYSTETPTLTATEEPTIPSTALPTTEPTASATLLPPPVVTETVAFATATELSTQQPAATEAPTEEADTTASNVFEYLNGSMLVGLRDMRSQITVDGIQRSEQEVVNTIDKMIRRYEQGNKPLIFNIVITDRIHHAGTDPNASDRNYWSRGNEHIGASDGFFQIRVAPDGKLQVFSWGRDMPAYFPVRGDNGVFFSGNRTTIENMNAIVSTSSTNNAGGLLTFLDDGGMPALYQMLSGEAGDLNLRFSLGELNNFADALLPEGVNIIAPNGFNGRYVKIPPNTMTTLTGTRLIDALRQRTSGAAGYGNEAGLTSDERGVAFARNVLLADPRNLLSVAGNAQFSAALGSLFGQNLQDDNLSLTVTGGLEEQITYAVLGGIFGNPDAGNNIAGLLIGSVTSGNLGRGSIISLPRPEGDVNAASFYREFIASQTQ